MKVVLGALIVACASLSLFKSLAVADVYQTYPPIKGENTSVVHRVHAVIEIPDIAPPKQLHSSDFLTFARNNAYKYVSCGDLFGNVRMADGHVFRAKAFGNINLGRCTFTVVTPSTTSSITSIFVNTLHGTAIGRPMKPSASTEPVENVSFNFQKIDVVYKVGKPAALDDWNAAKPITTASPHT